MKNICIKGSYIYSKLIAEYFKFLKANNKLNYTFSIKDACYYIDINNTIGIKSENINAINILDAPFYIRGTIYTQEIFNKLGVVNDGRFDCNVDNYVYYIENSIGECKIIGGVTTRTKIGEFIKDNWFDATDVLTEILIDKKPKSIEEFDKSYAKESYDLENEAELLTKLLKISCIYNDNKYPDWSKNTTKYAIKCSSGKLFITIHKAISSCIAFDKREYAEEYLKVFEKDLEKVKYWL